MNEKPLLALDIGTRKVAGLVALPHQRGLRILAACIIQHPDRSMVDGQVHKIEAVAEVVCQVKRELEKASGLKLTHAAVAAAGRALLTESAESRKQFPFITEITQAQVQEMELAAARAAYHRVQSGNERATLHCVGYSPVRMLLDNQRMDELAGHQGRDVTLEVLATFLPRQVVDSLLAVLRRADLQATTLTLEPIAAMEATIPPDLRRMNLALVDIGAGTSDIAVTRDGSVFAYAMVTEAGDEITESLCDHYLLEFAEAERVKRQLEIAGNKPLEFKTLLGQALRHTPAEVSAALEPAVNKLARAIAERILTLNGGAPKAVIMVGGGSATPGLGALLAQALGMDATRVGVRGPDTIPDLEDATGVLNGIEAVTLLGIAFSTLRGRGLNFFNVHVNGQAVQLLALHDTSTILDALVSSGHEIKRLYAKPGRAVTYTLQGKLQVARGMAGTPSVMLVNDRPAGLESPLVEGDSLTIQEAMDGEDAVLHSDSIPKPVGPVWCSINDRHEDLTLVLTLNGEPVSGNVLIQDRAELEWVSDRMLGELYPELASSGYELAFQVRVNGEVRRWDEKQLSITANGKAVGMEYRPRPDDRIEWKRTGAAVRVKDLVGPLITPARMTVLVNGQPKTLDYGGSRILVNGHPAQLSDLLPDQADVKVEKHADDAPILSQVLEGVPLVPPPSGGSLKLTVDGQPAGFTTPLRDGAKVTVAFV
jgi:cell division protein FtsA